MSAAGKRKTNLFLVLLLVLTLCFIWGNSLLPRAESTQLSTGVMDWLSPLLHWLKLELIDEHFIRKLAHFGEYAALGLELAGLFFLNLGRRMKSAVAAALCALLAAAADECLQFVSHRAPMVKDVLLDLSGALFGIALLALLGALRVKRTQENGLPD